MKNDRFSPEKTNPQAVMLQRQIYMREEKVLTSIFSKEKLYQNSVTSNQRHISPRVNRSLEYSPTDQKGRDSGMSHKRISSELDYHRGSQGFVFPNNRNWEFINKQRIGPAYQFKDRYDYNNRSPITWLAKQELVLNTTEKKPEYTNPHISELERLHSLNTKKILKGQGYMKTNIF